MNRIVWQGSTRSRKVQALLEQRVQAWYADWFPGSDVVPVVKMQSADVDAAAKTNVLDRCNGVLGSPAGPCLWMQWDAATPELMGCAALALPVNAGGSLACDVGERCIDALIQALGQFADVVTVERDPEVDPTTFATRHGGLTLSLEAVPGNVRIAVNHAWCGVHVPAAAAAPVAVALTTRRQALGQSPVTVTASIALGSIELLDSLQLRVGEVLVTDVSRDPRVALETASGKVALGRLQHVGTSRTIALD